MDPKRQREICSRGGKLAHLKGRAHEWNSETARKAGRKGGAAKRRERLEDDVSRNAALDDSYASLLLTAAVLL